MLIVCQKNAAVNPFYEAGRGKYCGGDCRGDCRGGRLCPPGALGVLIVRPGGALPRPDRRMDYFRVVTVPSFLWMLRSGSTPRTQEGGEMML